MDIKTINKYIKLNEIILFLLSPPVNPFFSCTHKVFIYYIGTEHTKLNVNVQKLEKRLYYSVLLNSISVEAQ